MLSRPERATAFCSPAEKCRVQTLSWRGCNQRSSVVIPTNQCSTHCGVIAKHAARIAVLSSRRVTFYGRIAPVARSRRRMARRARARLAAGFSAVVYPRSLLSHNFRGAGLVGILPNGVVTSFSRSRRIPQRTSPPPDSSQPTGIPTLAKPISAPHPSVSGGRLAVSPPVESVSKPHITRPTNNKQKNPACHE